MTWTSACHILATVTSLFAIGCVDRYPDKDYLSTYLTGTSPGQDATGGGTDAVSGSDTSALSDTSEGNTPLGQCLQSYCYNQTVGCYTDTICWSALQCVTACNGNTACENSCGGAGNVALLQLVTCATQYCSAYLGP